MLMFDGNLIHVTKRNSQLRDYLFVMGGGRKFEGQPMQFVGILSPTMGGHGNYPPYLFKRKRIL